MILFLFLISTCTTPVFHPQCVARLCRFAKTFTVCLFKQNCAINSKVVVFLFVFCFFKCAINSGPTNLGSVEPRNTWGSKGHFYVLVLIPEILTVVVFFWLYNNHKSQSSAYDAKPKFTVRFLSSSSKWHKIKIFFFNISYFCCSVKSQDIQGATENILFQWCWGTKGLAFHFLSVDITTM